MFIKGTPGVSSHPKLHTYEEGYLLPVLTGDELLFSHRHKGLLRQLRDLSESTTDDFDRSYAMLLTHFMEFVQVLPHKSNGILGSLLNYSLSRTVATFQKYCQLRKDQTTPLLKFAVFSAALLKDVGRVVSNQRVVLVDHDGEYLKEWNPLSGSMVGQSDFYKMYQLAASYLRIEAEITPLLARQLIPREIFLWLSSDLLVFSDWLAALLGQEGVGSKELTWALSLIKRDDILAILNTIDGASVNTHMPAATEYGEAFYQWLKEAIEKNELPINTEDAGIHVVSEGLLIEKRIFQHFIAISRFPAFANFLMIYTQFAKVMGIGKIGGADYINATYMSPGESAHLTTFSGGTRKGRITHEGMVVRADSVFLKGEIPAMSALKSVNVLTNTLHQQPPQSNSLASKIDLSSDY